MIKNEKQYKISKSQSEKFLSSINSLSNSSPEIHPLIIKAQREALESQYLQLKEEIIEYEKLKAGIYDRIELQSFDKLPIGLIKARIATGISQKDLADLLGLKEQQVQRYEATNYSSASFDRLKEVVKALNIDIKKEIFLPEEIIAKSRFFARLKDIGIDKNIVLTKLLPEKISYTLRESYKVTKEELKIDIAKAASILERIFKINPKEFFSDQRINLDYSHAFAVKFKKSNATNLSQISAYTFYANYLALNVLHATSHISQEPISSPEKIRKILMKDGKITFKRTLEYVWSLGIPVLVLSDPGSFHGACWRYADRNIIVLKQRTNSESRWIYDLIHELKHTSQYPNQSSFEIIEPDDMNMLTKDEVEANEFAGEILLGQDVSEIAIECIVKAKGNLRRLKGVVERMAVQKNIDVSALANYIAFRLSSEQGENWWGAANNLQHKISKSHEIARDILLKNIDLNQLNPADNELLIKAIN